MFPSTVTSRLACLIFATGLLAAQTPDSAGLRGIVFDPSHAAIPGTEVTLKNAATAFERKATSDSSGRFSISGLPAGLYSLTARKDGFADLLRDLTLVGGTAADLKIQLTVSSVQTQVTVTGASGEIRTDEPQLGDHLTAAQIEETPLLNRRITYLPLLN